MKINKGIHRQTGGLHIGKSNEGIERYSSKFCIMVSRILRVNVNVLNSEIIEGFCSLISYKQDLSHHTKKVMDEMQFSVSDILEIHEGRKNETYKKIFDKYTDIPLDLKFRILGLVTLALKGKNKLTLQAGLHSVGSFLKKHGFTLTIPQQDFFYKLYNKYLTDQSEKEAGKIPNNRVIKTISLKTSKNNEVICKVRGEYGMIYKLIDILQRIENISLIGLYREKKYGEVEKFQQKLDYFLNMYYSLLREVEILLTDHSYQVPKKIWREFDIENPGRFLLKGPDQHLNIPDVIKNKREEFLQSMQSQLSENDSDTGNNRSESQVFNGMESFIIQYFHLEKQLGRTPMRGEILRSLGFLYSPSKKTQDGKALPFIPGKIQLRCNKT